MTSSRSMRVAISGCGLLRMVDVRVIQDFLFFPILLDVPLFGGRGDMRM